MKKILPALVFLFYISCAIGQNNEQNIRGVVLDKLARSPLPGVSLVLLSATPTKGTTTDENGNFLLSGLPPDRYEIKVSFLGYKTIFLHNLIVTSGKELILEILMDEDLKQMEDVVVTGTNKAHSINKLATVSARTFSMEEVNRYAGGRSDPARLAANFAGVSAPDDSRNDIVIRGNSPVGVLWRIDGMNVTNPNHFASVGTTGGAVSALNTNLLKNSDFFTSAFPAEYGNATAGVFDLGFRSGNTAKRETTLQVGVITGLEATTEGPISKSNGSSYLVGYRYALAGVAQAAGIDIGTTATPSYQDLSFKINSGTTPLGKFSLFGILASSTIALKSGSSGSLYGNGNQTDFGSKIGIAGLTHFLQINTKSYLSSLVGLNYSSTDQTDYMTNRQTLISESSEVNKVAKTGYNIATSYNTKINSRWFLKVGVQDELLGLYLNYKTRRDRPEWAQVWDYDSYTQLAQAFVHAKYNVNERLILNGGVHSQYFAYTKSTSVEPRFGASYDLTDNSSLTAGYGLHAQMQPLNVYFLQTQWPGETEITYTNQKLDFTKSHHFVLGYNLQPLKDWRIKAEAYYQSIYNVPVNSFSSSYSMLNTGASFKTDLEDSLVNNGTGKNYGIELTIEKFFSQGYYGLFTSSIYSSKYKASDGVERNTAFNGRYVYNALAGKEWKTGRLKINKISVDLKFTNAGGRAYTPIDLAASQLANRQVSKGDAFAYSSFYEMYYRFDVKIGFTLNSSVRKIGHTFSLDLQNVTNHKNVFSQSFDDRDQKISTTYQLGFFPNFIYRFQF